MEIKEQISLRFFGLDIVNVEFNIEKRFQLGNGEDVLVDIQPSVFYPDDDSNEFKIIMDTTIEVKGYFFLKLRGIGNFIIENNLDEKIKHSFINVNAPAIMFPYIRTFVSTFTANIGDVTDTLTLPPQFFSGDLSEFVAEEDSE
jgi:preprotein translocase subunit SecB